MCSRAVCGACGYVCSLHAVPCPVSCCVRDPLCVIRLCRDCECVNKNYTLQGLQRIGGSWFEKSRSYLPSLAPTVTFQQFQGTVGHAPGFLTCLCLSWDASLPGRSSSGVSSSSVGVQFHGTPCKGAGFLPLLAGVTQTSTKRWSRGVCVCLHGACAVPCAGRRADRASHVCFCCLVPCLTRCRIQ